jgi:hypothetical protein
MIPAPAEAGSVTYATYPPQGWLGWCTVPDCVGQSPRAIQLGYAYNTGYYYFVYYATADAFKDDGSSFHDELQAWLEAYFAWAFVASEPEAPDSSEVQAILSGINAPVSPLTVTLLWNAAADLDLYFYCDDGSVISW